MFAGIWVRKVSLKERWKKPTRATLKTHIVPRKTLVGLQMQRMVYFLWCITVPIGIIWLCSDMILLHIVPEREVAMLAGKYLKIILVGAPGFACFESGKRYLQAQGLFSASLYVLLICAPLNAFMNWLFVWVCFRSYLLAHHKS